MSKFIDQNDSDIDALKLYAISVFILVIVSSLMAINVISLTDFLRIIASCAMLIGIYSLILRVFLRHDVSVLIVIVSLIFLPFLPFLRYMAYLLSAVGLAILLFHKYTLNKYKLLFLPVSILIIFGSGMYSDFQYQRTLLMGTTHIDTLFHAAIAAMYSHFGVASIGLDGLVPIVYHTLSHKIMAGLAILTGFETLAVYAYLFFAMGPLLLVFSLAGFACQLNSQLNFDRALLGIVLCMLTIISIPVFSQAALWDSFFVSESYLVALVIFAVSLTTFIRFVEGGGANIMPLATSLALLIFAGLTKGSVGLVGVCVFGLFGITKFRTFKYWLLMAIASVFLYFALIASATSATQFVPVVPLHFISTYVGTKFHLPLFAKLLLFLSIHLLPVWICFFLGVRKSGAEYFKTNEFQILFALLIPALLFALTFKIAGGSAYYFSSIPVIISLPFLAYNLINLLNEIKIKHVISVLILASLILFPTIVRKSFLITLVGSQASNPALLEIVKKLQYIRDNSATNTIIKIENPEYLVKTVGCNVYWFLPAVAERPIMEGFPNARLCPNLGVIYYGLSDYNPSKRKLTSDVFKVITLNIKNN